MKYTSPELELLNLYVEDIMTLSVLPGEGEDPSDDEEENKDTVLPKDEF